MIEENRVQPRCAQGHVSTAAGARFCAECGWLRPLAPGYAIDQSAFQWSEDGKAMSALRALKPLNAAARAVSDKIGRRWIETTFNAVLLGENQLPEVYAQAVRAARLLGMSHMPLGAVAESPPAAMSDFSAASRVSLLNDNFFGAAPGACEF